MEGVAWNSPSISKVISANFINLKFRGSSLSSAYISIDVWAYLCDRLLLCLENKRN